jgi:hypothetical protein
MNPTKLYYEDALNLCSSAQRAVPNPSLHMWRFIQAKIPLTLSDVC